MDIYKNYQNKVHIIGHKNPDTDSICSAIAYAHLKNQISEAEHIPRSAGLLNEETHYVLAAVLLVGRNRIDAADI